jgi:hypothetical protein
VGGNDAGDVRLLRAATGDAAAASNRPGLPAIAFRAGTYAAFRLSMLQRIAQTPALAAPAPTTTTPSRCSTCGQPSPTS